MVKKDKIEAEKGKWAPAVGSVRPKFEAISTNESQKLLSISPLPNMDAQNALKNIRIRQTSLCDRLVKK